MSYNIDLYATHPSRINIKEELQTNYSLRESTVRAHSGSLTETAKDGILFNWASGLTGSNVFETTGATGTDSLHADATGSRKALTKQDIRNVAKKMDKDRMPKNGRYMMINADMYYELFTDSEILSFDFMDGKALPTGVITKLFGINIIVSDQVIYFDDQTLIPVSGVSSATNATLHQGALIWHEQFVAKAFRGVEVFLEEKDPKNFGASFFSAGIFLGATALRGEKLDWEGVYAIRQAV